MRNNIDFLVGNGRRICWFRPPWHISCVLFRGTRFGFSLLIYCFVCLSKKKSIGVKVGVIFGVS